MVSSRRGAVASLPLQLLDTVALKSKELVRLMQFLEQTDGNGVSVRQNVERFLLIFLMGSPPVRSVGEGGGHLPVSGIGFIHSGDLLWSILCSALLILTVLNA